MRDFVPSVTDDFRILYDMEKSLGEHQGHINNIVDAVCIEFKDFPVDEDKGTEFKE